MPNVVRYILRFPEPSTHYAEVEGVFPVEGKTEANLSMAVWTPGSYLVRDYSRHVEAVCAEGLDGVALPVEKVSKNRWRVATDGALAVRVRYRVYCREMSVRTNWVEDGFALLNGAPLFLALVGALGLEHTVRLELPDGWKTSATGMEAGDGPHHYRAEDYDTLVDSPIVAGNPAVHEFEVAGIPHFLVNQGEEPVWDGARAAVDLKKIVEAHLQMWGSLPYRNYVFLNLITEAGGGLEHKNSVVMMTSRWATRTRKAWLGWLDLASHEYFHVWNVKRLRPMELGPFDYERENPTRSLWVAEGITDYFASLLVRRAGISTVAEYLSGVDGSSGLGGIIHRLQTTPGRLVQSAEQSSFDAWTKLYRPDENSGNTTISYYTKGTVVAWLLDARIRKATGGANCLDDLMRLAFGRYSGDTGFTPEQFKAAAEEIAGVSLAAFFRQAVESTEELDYTEALDWFGLRFKSGNKVTKHAWLGVETKMESGRLVVTKVPRGTPAIAAGINVDDEMIAIDEIRVPAEKFSKRLENYQPGEKVSMLVARRERLMRIAVTFGEDPGKPWQLEVHPDADADQRRHLEAWLGA
jgi:predicted metalloprotease with PDZ domain